MKANKYNFLSSLIAYLCFVIPHAYADIQLDNGIVPKSNIGNSEQKKIGWEIDDLTPNGNAVSKAFTNLGGGDIYYSISNNGKISVVNLPGKKYLYDWPLSRWPAENDELNKKIYDMDMGSGFTEEQQWDKPHVNLGSTLATGCLGSIPLRYGDIDRDGKQELAIFAQDKNLQLDLMLFSPEKKSVAFSARLALQDYIPFPAPTATTQNNFRYQYVSEENQLAYHIGIRAYAKIFIDDFNGNNQKDILVWRKRFESLKFNDSKKGFGISLEAFNHYELVNGEYKKQPTDNATIKNWLAAKQLTWQKGYPSKNECKGQEGQLISEFHDPLLNDPEVLK